MEMESVKNEWHETVHMLDRWDAQLRRASR